MLGTGRCQVGVDNLTVATTVVSPTISALSLAVSVAAYVDIDRGTLADRVLVVGRGGAPCRPAPLADGAIHELVSVPLIRRDAVNRLQYPGSARPSLDRFPGPSGTWQLVWMALG